MIHLLRKKEDVPVKSTTPEVKIHEYFTKEDNKDLDLCLVELNGTYGKNMNKKCCLIYYVIQGSMKMEIGEESFELEEGDATMIPVKTPYWMKGNAKFILASAPAWYPEQYVEDV